ncbi:MAG: hypothetical protein V7L04_09995 [Nostoc sp.]
MSFFKNQCPMPNTSLLRLRQRHRSVQVPNAQCPMPNAQFPIPIYS